MSGPDGDVRPRSQFGKVWSGATLSNLADGLFLMALPLIALTVTSSPALIAGLRALQTLPWFLLGLFVGVLVDRYDRRRLILYAEMLRGSALACVALTAVLGHLTFVVLCVAAVVVGIAETISETAAQAMVPMVVPADRLQHANGRLFGAQMVMNDFVGAPLGAALVAIGVATALVVPASLYLAAGAVLLTVTGNYTVRQAKTATVRADIREGIREIWRGRTVARLTVYSVVSNLTNTAFFAVFVVFAVGTGSTLRLSGLGFSLLITTAAVGAVCGAMLAGRIGGRVPPRLVLTVAVISLCCCFATPVLFPHPIPVGLALLFSGFATSVSAVLNSTIRQSLVPARLLGRVSAGIRFLSYGARPVGAFAGGLIAQATSPRSLFAGLAVAILALLPLTLTFRVVEPSAAAGDEKQQAVADILP